MSLLSRLEAALERLAEGGAERVFGGRLDLVAVGQELFNVATDQSRPVDTGPVAPNSYSVKLALNEYGELSGEIVELQRRYARALWRRLRGADYALDGPPAVLITPLESLPTGSFEATGEFVATQPAFTVSNVQGGGAHRLTAPATVGRGAECDLQLNSASVSREHARIVWDRNGFSVVDLSSKNGTQVNGVLVSEADIDPGDVLTLGDVAMAFATDTET